MHAGWTLAGALLIASQASALQETEAPEVRAIKDKTLVVWVAPANLEQRGGGVLSLGATSEHFDAIVFGEIEPGRWMAGSDFFRRTHQDQSAWPAETADPGDLVRVAVTYEGRVVTVHRDGEEYARYEMATDPTEFTTESLVTLGLRHLGAGNGYFAGRIEEARIYDRALTADEVRSLEPDSQAGPDPLACWTFEDGGTADAKGTFPDGTLMGGARVEEGALVLDGVSGCMLVRKPVSVVREEGGWPTYHITALEDEGIACPYDSNGCIYWNGRYHLMYIFQRADGGHCWGHASSPDLVDWTFHPTALEPRPGDPDRGIFSGNAYLNKDGVPMLCWFGVESGVCVATATDDDLIGWEKHPANPIIPMPKEGEPGFGVYTVWDPYLWLEGDTYVCLLGGNKLPSGHDTLYVCTSPDLVNWTPLHPLYEGNLDWRRLDEDCSCPDFFRLGDRHVLMCISHAVGARFYEGRFDADEMRFYPETHVRMNWPGGMFFAPESLEAPDGRRVFWAWVTDPRVRPAQEPTGSGFQSLPRVLDFSADGTPLITPAGELEALRGEHRAVESIALPAGETVELPDIRALHTELLVEIQPGDAESVSLALRCSADGSEETLVRYITAEGVLRVDVSRSTLRDDVVYGSPPFTAYGLQTVEGANSIATFDAPLTLGEDETLRLRVFVDGPMLEVFANNRQCVTQVVFPKDATADRVRLRAEGGSASLVSCEAWQMRGLTIRDER